MADKILLLNEDTQAGEVSGAGRMRNRCAFTSRDMAADWPEAFTYAIVFGWPSEADKYGEPDDPSAMEEIAAKYEWDAPLIAFLEDAHKRFKELSDDC